MSLFEAIRTYQKNTLKDARRNRFNNFQGLRFSHI
jgi:hypothetical protein